MIGSPDPVLRARSEASFRAELDAGNHYVGAFVDGVGLVGYAGVSVVGREADVHTLANSPDSFPARERRQLLDSIFSYGFVELSDQPLV